jgi:hypothetical protein
MNDQTAEPTVWMVCHMEPYEGPTIDGIYSSEEKAEERVEELTKEGRLWYETCEYPLL